MALLAVLLVGCGPRGVAAPVPHSLPLPGGTTLPYHEQGTGDRIALLMHRAGAGPEVWEGFAQQLAGRGFRVLTPQLPGGNASLPAARALWKHANPGDDPRHIVVGEEAGALLALELAATEPGAGALVLLSPPLKADGLEALARMRGFEQCPVLLMAAEDDMASATATLQLKEAAPAFCEIQLYPGASSGADLFAIRPASMLHIFDWLNLILGKNPPKG